MYSPCIFEQLPIFGQQFGQSQIPFTIRPQRQQQAVVNRTTNNKDVRFSTVATEEGLLLTIKKPLNNKNAYKLELQKRVLDIKNKYAQKPKYSIVTDVWGNQYYVDVTAKLQEQMVEEINKIDMSVISRKLAKESFSDYELELSHDGYVLNITSKKDSIEKNLTFGSVSQGLFVKTCTLEDESFAVLKITIVLDNKSPVVNTSSLVATKNDEDGLDKLINWARESALKENKTNQQKKYDQLVGCSSINDCKKIQKKKDQEERNKKEQQEKARRIEIKKQKKLEQLKLRKEHELAVQKEREVYETKLVEEQRKNVQEMIRQQVMAEKQKAEQESRRQHEAAVAAEQEARKQRAAAAVAEQEARKQRAAAVERQRLETVAEELAKKQKIAELNKQKAIEESERLKREQTLLKQQQYQRQLVEEERQLKAAQLLAASQATPVIPYTDNESDDDMDVDSESDNDSTTLRKHSSPLLEEVNDEEVDRYNDSVSQRKPSNSGYEPIIEDM
ncbi:similar to Saccharomyces cerevisiae YGR142W BTN2 v-SNARE binding protein that facilitates specific protein retrieval from a late endosome to the Golgi [Maudiozyma saulgeensis]|uniref:Similar to Saccharomyces cerevisiae YGR142W BTN2 v-SNARE binding protein that facilitates specific protein retrieval from a late endosome to the Golgi n=1 Tax=Maudiozyma saulgeensis TaxID=1789683 RepID=A0A1X7QXD6_9SACH|nr:similar to Saccharomyces cerevisiae YGR142W BTN2 v-SNARE binding protein that facilitates specific protein retrieval from a late endosome to the Golgi [Kazachstania saulgeensis]